MRFSLDTHTDKSAWCATPAVTAKGEKPGSFVANLARMRLRRESVDEVGEDSEEYRTAVKSVIRCQIQSLLQKLAVVTGEESIVISTNVTAGTYNHLGSYLGAEYLGEDAGNQCVQNLCENFTNFCAGLVQADQVVLIDPDEPQSQDKPKKLKSSLPAPKSTPRKRPLDRQSLPESPPLKRRPDYFVNLEDKEDNSSHVVDSVSSQSGLPLKQGEEGAQVTWIKIEPTESVQEDNKPKESENSVDQDGGNSHTSIINRRKALIPLASISKHQGAAVKPVKTEAGSKLDGTEQLPSEKSILRSLYENQPVLPLSTFATMSNEPDRADTAETVADLSSPLQINENVDQYSSGTSENLVLSGYYDSDSYPTYRHRQKHPANNQARDAKKAKTKDKTSPQKIEPAPAGAGIDFHLRTFESGGRLVYACDVCKRELSHLTSYRRHMKLHTMERPHKCPICDKGFIRKYHCIDHINKHHKGVPFDPETLNVPDGFVPENPESSALSESMDGSTSEYNYTLDQSLSVSDLDQSIKGSIDQYASNMLSELAKSAAQHSQLSSSKESLYDSSVSTNRSPEISLLANQSDEMDEIEANQSGESIGEEAELARENGITGSQSNDGEWSGEAGSSGSERRTEVTQGIKAIIAHLKKNKQKLACDSNGTPVSMKAENKND